MPRSEPKPVIRMNVFEYRTFPDDNFFCPAFRFPGRVRDLPARVLTEPRYQELLAAERALQRHVAETSGGPVHVAKVKLVKPKRKDRK